MKPKNALRFRTQIVAVVIASVGLTVAIGYGGLTVAGAVQMAALIADMSPEARRAAELLEEQKIPEPSDLEALMAEAADAEIEAERSQNATLAVLTLIAAIIGGATGAALASRFSRPVEEVARAARSIANGDLSARVPAERQGAGETGQLIADFNNMAAALENAERELRESSAAIAHELRTPLTVLRGRLQGIADGVFPPGPREIASLIRQVEALAAIVEDLRVLSLASVQALELRLSAIDLGEEVEAVATSFAPDLAARGMSLDLTLAPAKALADPARVRQAATALIENALRYAAEGRRLRLDVRAEGDMAVLQVLDRGPGFAPEDLTKVFDRFWRADLSRSREVGGSGLGLSVVRAIALAHGGTCRAANREGGGALIEVRLPAAAGAGV